MASNKVIVFGPTGHVGSAAALAAQEQGAKVYLAMRDSQKAIRNLTPAQEQAGGFERVQADLSNPDSIRTAVTQTGAKRAFIYIAFGTPDNMRSTIQALKSAGIEFLVFLSSFGVDGDLRSIQPTDLSAFVHGQVEINLDEVYGPEGYVAIRPGYFATNLLLYKKPIAAGGVVRMPYPQVRFDCIAPEDIGRVSGVVLAKAQSSGPIFLAGPQLVAQEDAIKLVAKALGKDVQVEGFATEQDAAKFLAEAYGVPEALGAGLARTYRAMAEGEERFPQSKYQEAVANVKKYGLKEPTSLDQWVEAHRAEFLTE
ncbi:hypothetical protein VTI74DRAFT_8058 [Chaetomium olivicolor]